MDDSRGQVVEDGCGGAAVDCDMISEGGGKGTGAFQFSARAGVIGDETGRDNLHGSAGKTKVVCR